MTKEKKDLLFFGYGLAVIAAIFLTGGTLKHGFLLSQKIQAVCIVVFVAVTSLRWEALRPGYQGWMKVAHMIGSVVTTVLLSTVFFLLFAPIGILFRLIGKDHLERKIDKASTSYWHTRPVQAVEKERFTQQF